MQKKNTDCKCGSLYKNVRVHFILCKCRLKKAPPVKPSDNKKKVCYQINYYQDGSTSTTGERPGVLWHRTPEEDQSSIRYPPMTHRPEVGEALGIPNNFPSVGNPNSSNVSVPRVTQPC